MSTLSKTKTEAPPLRRFLGSHPFWQLRKEMEDAFGNMLGEGSLLSASVDMIPSVDVSETDAEVQVQTDLPGFKPEEVDIEINDNYLTISGTHTEEQEDKPGNGRKYHQVERRSGSFSRSVLLPCAVKQDAVEAELKEGVLTVTLPKSEEARRQKITVKG